MKPLITFLLLSLLVLEGCTPIIKLSYGIRQPKQETPASITRFLEKHEYPLTDQYIMKDSSAYVRLMSDSILKSLLASPIFFRSDLKRMARDTTHCQWSGGTQVQHLKKDTTYTCYDDLNFSDIWPYIKPLSDTVVKPVVNPGDYDFILLYTWGSFMGKLNERVFVVNDAIETRPDLKILLVYLNFDMQRSWNLSKDQKYKLD